MVFVVCAGLNFEAYKPILASLKIIGLALLDYLHQPLPDASACQQSCLWEERPDSLSPGELWVAPNKKRTQKGNTGKLKAVVKESWIQVLMA